MEKNTLLALRATAERSFNELVAKKQALQQQHNQQIDDIDLEMARLQGEYRVYTNLIDNSPDPAYTQTEINRISPQAHIIDVEEALKGDGK